MIVLGVLTDGRADCLAGAMETVHRLGDFDARFIVNDSGDCDYASWLRCNFPGFKTHHHSERRGLAGAVQAVWDQALELDADYLVHLEDDFEILADVDVSAICAVLGGYPDVAQMLLKRQPIVAPELEANDILGGMGALDVHDGWVTQQAIFSLNPCVIPRWVLEMGWPAGNEAGMTEDLLRQGARFGVWGDPGSPPLVHHTGDSRSAGWKL